MTRGLAALGSAVFFLIAPTTVAGVVPWWISRWRLQASFFDLQLIRWFGVVLILHRRGSFLAFHNCNALFMQFSNKGHSCIGVIRHHPIGFSQFTIQGVPNSSVTMPKRLAQNVSPIGMTSAPPSESWPKIRSASAGSSTATLTQKP
jgi:hypothetical protein